ncbi:MAG: hypothetical protein ACREDR_21555, partial [Blastocatellia bacterium]
MLETSITGVKIGILKYGITLERPARLAMHNAKVIPNVIGRRTRSFLIGETLAWLLNETHFH